MVQQLQAAGTLLGLLEETHISQGDRQLLRQDLQGLLFPARQAPLLVVGLEVQHAEHLAFQDYRRPEHPGVAGSVQRRPVKQRRLRQHHQATLAHHATHDALTG